MDEKLIKGTLHKLDLVLDPVVMPTDHYAQGVIIGIVTGIMAATNTTFKEAIQICQRNAPENVKALCIPYGWESDEEINK